MMVHEIAFEDVGFPSRLVNSKSFPKTLYYKGDISLLNQECIAVIGKRETTPRYAEIAKRVGCLLAQNNYVVLNGLARGIDKSVMEGALEKRGKVIAVMPCGLDYIYPSSCKSVAEKIIKQGGCILSQYPIGVKPEKYRFIERDKTQAQLASKVFVIDSLRSGGTMHTVSYAYKEGKAIGCLYETTRENPEGNVYMVNKYGASKIENSEALMDFLRKKPMVQLSFLFA